MHCVGLQLIGIKNDNKMSLKPNGAHCDKFTTFNYI